MKKIAESYDRIEDFRQFIEKEDPNKIFRTSYWERAIWEI
jgi:hypothetical protein